MPLPGISQPGCERSLTRELRVSPRKAGGRLPALAAIYPFIIPSQGWPIVPLSDRSENLWGKPLYSGMPRPFCLPASRSDKLWK